MLPTQAAVAGMHHLYSPQHAPSPHDTVHTLCVSVFCNPYLTALDSQAAACRFVCHTFKLTYVSHAGAMRSNAQQALSLAIHLASLTPFKT